ncbi:MAG TPA: EamA family transporter [Actinocrinis sp.]|nr:EamA family transporter [Actinocrinis sp.]
MTVLAAGTVGGGPSGGLIVVGVVLLSAVLHATWNALTHSARDRVAAIALIGVAAAGCAGVGVLFAPIPDRAAWPFIAASFLLQVGYSYALVLAYRLGEFSSMYPLARGTSPLVVALVGTFVVGQPMSGLEAVGVLTVSGGLLALAFADGRPRRADLPAIGAAVGTGCFIAAYTVVDGIGVRRSGSVFGYASWTFLFQGVLIVLVAVALRRRALLASLRPDWARGLAGGVVSVAAYSMVLWAQTKGTLAGIATLRETSILIGCVIGSVVFHERFGRNRLIASAGVVTGILLIARP